MELDWGAFGAAARGESVSEFKRSRSDEERRKKEDERDDAYRKDIEGIPSPDDAHKTKLAEYEKANRQSEVDASTARSTAEVVGNPVAAQGIKMPSGTFSEDTAQRVDGNVLSRAAGSPASIISTNGVGAAGALRQEIARPDPMVSPEAPKAPGMNDWLEFATKRAAIDVKHGKLNGLGMMQLAQARKQLMDEGVDEAVMKFQQGDAAGGLESFNASGKYVGAKLVGEPQRGEFDYNGVKMPTTIVTLQLPNGRTETINTAQYGTARIKAENQFSAAVEMMKHKDNKAHQADTLAETKRNHIATEGIARTKAVEGIEGSTAEIKNARVFFPDLYKENPAKALSAFKDLTTGEMTAAKVRQTLLKTYEEGFWPDEAGTTQKEKDAFINERVKFVMGKPESTAKPTATTPPPTNSRGWKLHTDANGNRAYVSPDRKQFEEVK